jgi:hypothetical protein
MSRNPMHAHACAHMQGGYSTKRGPCPVGFCLAAGPCEAVQVNSLAAWAAVRCSVDLTVRCPPLLPLPLPHALQQAAACLGKNTKVAKKLPSLVLPMAAAKLATAFGLELRELRRPTAGGCQGAFVAFVAGEGALVRVCV